MNRVGGWIGAVLLGLSLLGLPVVQANGTQWDIPKITKDAEGGLSQAQVLLAHLHHSGIGTPQDYGQAFSWYQKAAEQGSPFAQFKLGLKYDDAKNYKQAINWWRKSADQGYSYAQVNLGTMYAQGLGVTKNNKQAVQWFRKAAEQGVSDAQFKLGYQYKNGLGVTKNDKQAVAWWRKAAEQGHPFAQGSIAACYGDGSGVPQDYVQTYAWFSVAAANGVEEFAKSRDKAAKLLTPDQLAKGQELAASYFEKYQPK